MSDFNWSLYPGSEDLSRKQKLVNAYVDQFDDFARKGYGLFIQGRTAGSGKTYLAESICGELLEKWSEGTVAFATESDLLEASKQRTEDGTDPLNRYISCRLLVIDDIGQKNTGKNWLSDVLFRVIDHRYRDHRPTLYTSNLPLDQFPDSRIADRINATTYTITLPDISIRARKAADEKTDFLKDIGIL